MLYTILILHVDFTNMHIYTFIVPHMHKDAFKCILAYICTHLHIFIHEDTIILDSCTHNMHTVA